MNQPGLGLKVYELRQQKGMTQEQLIIYFNGGHSSFQRIGHAERRPLLTTDVHRVLGCCRGVMPALVKPEETTVLAKSQRTGWGG